MYQGMPIMCKQLMLISNNPSKTANLMLTNVSVEMLAVNVPFSPGTQGFSDQSYIDPAQMIVYSGLLYLENDAVLCVCLYFYVFWFSNKSKPYV